MNMLQVGVAGMQDDMVIEELTGETCGAMVPQACLVAFHSGAADAARAAALGVTAAV